MNNQTVDQRIVEMQFNNSDFESKITKTLEHLQKLREATKMEDSGKEMENLAKSVKKIDVHSLADGIDSLNKRFSAFGIAGMTVIQDLTRAAERLGAKLVDAITTAPKDGWKEYELYTDSVKTILNSAKDANGLPVTLDLVNEKLAELNEYSDKTIYSFSDMTQNIGKFTNAGVDLESAVKAIQGVANVAALSGANANEAARAMYNFGQALGTGSVKLIDWKSIVNANMATVDFKNELIKTAEELGTIKKQGDKWISTTYKGKKANEDAFTATSKFDDSLQQQWMTAAVLTKTLEKYTDEETELGKKAIAAAQEVTTFNKMIDTIKESMGSGWMNTWQLIFGDFEEQKQLWTGIYLAIDDVVQKVASFRNGILKTWKELGGRDDLIKAFSNLWDIAKAFVEPIKDAFASIFPDVTGDNLADISKKFREATDNLKEMFGIVDEKAKEAGKTIEKVKDTVEDLTELAQAVIRGDYGNGNERRKKLEEEGKSYEKVQNKVNELLGCAFRYKVAEEDLTEAMDENTEAGKRSETQMKRLMDAEGEMNRKQTPLEKLMTTISDSPWMHHNALENTSLFFAGIASGVNVIKEAISDLKIVEKIAWAAGKAFGFVSDVFGNVGRYLLLINGYLLETKPWLKVADVLKNSVGSISDKLAKFKAYLSTFKNISRITKAISSGVKGIRDRIAELFRKVAAGESTGVSFKGLTKILDVLKSIGKFIGGGLLSAVDKVLGIIFSVIDGTKSFKDSLGEFKVLEVIHGWFEKIKATALNLVQNTKISGWFDSIAKTFEPLTKLVEDFFGKAEEDGSKAFSGTSDALGEFGSAVEDGFAGFREGGIIDRAINLLGKVRDVLKDLPGLVNNAIDSILEKGSLEFVKIPNSIEEFTTQLSNFIGKIKTNALETITGAFHKLADAIREFANNKFLKPFSKAINSVADSLDAFAQGVHPWIEKISGFITKVIEKLDGVSFKGVGLFMFLTAISYFAVKWASVGRVVANAFNNLSEFILHGSKPFNKLKDKMKSFVLLAAALELVAGALWIVSKIDPERFVPACVALGIALALMTGAIIGVEKAVTHPEDLKAAAIAFLGISASLVILAKAMDMWSGMEPEKWKAAVSYMTPIILGLIAAVKLAGASGLGAGLAFVGIAAALMIMPGVIETYANLPADDALAAAKNIALFIGEMAAAIRIAGHSGLGTGLAFVGVAASLWIMAKVVDKYSKLTTDQLIGTGGAIFGFLTIMTAAVKIVGKDAGAGKAFTGIAIGLIALWFAIKMYASTDLGTLVGGGTAVFIFMTMLAAAARLAGGGTSKNIIALSVSMLIIAGAVKLMATVPWKRMLVSAVAMKLVLGSVTKALQTLDGLDVTMKDVGKIALLMGAALAEVVIALLVLDKLGGSTDRLLGIAESMTLVLLAVSVPIAILQDVNWDAGARAAVAVGEFLGGLLVVFAAIGEVVSLLSSLTGQSDEDGWKYLEEQAAHIGNVLNAFGSHLLNGDVEETAKKIPFLQSIAEDLTEFAKAAKDFFNSVDEVDDSTAERGKKLAEAVLAICTADLLDTITQWIGGKFDGKKFGESLGEIGRAFKTLNEYLSDENLDIQSDKFDQMIDVVKKFADLANAIPKIGGIEQKLKGTADLGKFAASMYEFLTGKPGEGVQGFRGFLAQMAYVELSDGDLTKIENVKKATKKLADVAESIPETGGILQKITGVHDLAGFATAMTQFLVGTGDGNGIGGFKAFAWVIKYMTVDQGVIDKIDGYIIPATEAMVGLGKTIKENKSIFEFFTGAGTDLSGFGTAMSGFASDMKEFSSTVRGIAVARISEFTDVVERYAELNGDERLNSSAIWAFGEALGELGNGFALFNDYTSPIDLENVAAILEQLVSLEELMTKVSENEYDVTSLGSAMEALATTSIHDFADAVDESAGSATEAIGRLMQACIAATDGFDESFINSGIKYIQDIYNQFNSLESIGSGNAAITDFIAAVIKTCSNAVGNKETGFYVPGRKAIENFGYGLEDSWVVGIVKAKAVDSLINGPTEELGQKKHMDKYFKQGQNAAEGFAKGIVDKASDAVKAAKEMAEEAQAALASANESHSPSRVYRRLGTYVGEGYALGILDKANLAVTAINRTGYAGIKAMRKTVEKMNSMIDEEIDYRPTITPVMDLSQLANGMRTTSGLLGELNNSKTGLEAAIDISTAHNEALARANARANKDYSGDLGTLIERLTTLNETAKRNNIAIIDGDYLYGYMDRRLGMA